MTTTATTMDVIPDQLGLAGQAARLEHATPQEILRWAVLEYRPGIAVAASFGMQSVVIIDMLHRMELLSQVELFCIDTGVLFPQTHETRRRIEAKYGCDVVRVGAKLTWDEQQRKFDGHLYERGEDGINRCCYIRKVEPMRDYLAGQRAWITGMRRKHSAARAAVPVLMWDDANELVKVNPLACADEDTLWAYIEDHDVPYNPLYDQGYASIGCNTPICTQPVGAGCHARDGRWAGTTKTECGIHLGKEALRSLESSGL